MKTITTNTSGLLNAVAVANTFTHKDGDFAGMITLAGNDSKLEVKSSDFIQTVIFKNIGFVSSDLIDTSFSAFSINGKKLNTVLKAAKGDEVNLELHPEHIVVKSGRSKVKIETLANTQEILIENNGSSISFGNLIGRMEQLLHAVDTGNPKYELNGMLLQAKNGVFNLVSTDTKRMSINSSATDLNDMEAIVPKEAISTISKLFKGFEIKAKVDNTNLSVNTDMINYQTKLINGKFPEWQRIVPRETNQTFTMSRYGLKVLVEEASVLEQNIVINIGNGKIALSDEEHNTTVVDSITTDNTDIKFAMDSKSLLDFLNSFDDENVQIAFNASNLPVMLVASPEYKEVVMPYIMMDEEKLTIATEDDITEEVRHAA